MSISSNLIDNKRPGLKKYVGLFFVLLLILILALSGIKAWRIYQKGSLVYQDVTNLRVLAQRPISELEPELVTSTLLGLQGDLEEFKQETKPLLWLGPKLAWMPTYGGDVGHAEKLVELADYLVNASVISIQAAKPLLMELNAEDSSLSPAGLTTLLVDAQTGFMKAQAEIDKALDARANIQDDLLSPRLRAILSDLDPMIELLNDGLSISSKLPVVLGADGGGSKTYLILVQNEDELRPTGGFITTVGTLVINDGQIEKLEFEGVDNAADWSKPFPVAPWQLQEYMNARVLILRDSNWYADFPTSALWAKYLYAYDHPEPVDGVIAFDQQFLIMVLGVLGPLEVEGAPYLVTSENAVEFMRTAKEPPKDELISPDGWYRKEFIEDTADAVLHKLIGGENRNWQGLATVFVRALEERHLLIQFDDPEITSLLSEHDWDNSIRPPAGTDYLMTIDTNIGFNKTNALMNVSLSYDVDLTDLSAPGGSLVVTHRNNSSKDVECIQYDTGQVPADLYYPMNRCYWNYFRVYKQAGVELMDAGAHDIPRGWMLFDKNVPPQVDILHEEIDGVSGFGTLMVVPGGQSVNTSFDFALSPSILQNGADPGIYTFRLKVRKQPGTRANPLEIRIHLPNHAKVEEVNLDALNQGENLLINTNLLTDVYLELVFHVQ